MDTNKLTKKLDNFNYEYDGKEITEQEITNCEVKIIKHDPSLIETRKIQTKLITEDGRQLLT